jgi:hypothetical protein
MQKRLYLFILVAVAFLVGCGGGGGGGGSSSSSGSVLNNYSGVAIDGALYKATAFLDLNGNGQLDSGEPSAITASDGSFALNATQDQINSHSVVVIATAGTTIDQDNPNIPVSAGMTMMAPVGSPAVISPITTLVVAQVANGLSLDAAKSAVQSQLALNGVDPLSNYLVSQGSNSNTHKIASSIASVLQYVNAQSTSNTTVASYLSSLTTNTANTVIPQLSTILLSKSVSDAASLIKSNLTNSGTQYSVGGTISGLNGSGLVLANGTSTLSPSASATSFIFSTKLTQGSNYAVTVQSNPSGQVCTVSNSSGAVSTYNVTGISVSCVNIAGLIGGTIAGLNQSGLVLTTGAEDLVVPINSSSFSFSNPVNVGSTYSVSVKTQPSGKTCSVSNGSGAMTSGGINSVQVACATSTYSIGGSISGLATSGLTLKNGAEIITISSGSNSFIFSSPVAVGGSYQVTVNSQPTGYTCSVTNGSGTIVSTNITSVAVNCSALTYSIGGTISGLSYTGSYVTNGLKIQLNGTSLFVYPASGETTFNVADSIPYGSSYTVAVAQHPTGQYCSIANSNGQVAGNVNNIAVTCVSNVLLANISGLTSGQTLGLTAQANYTNSNPAFGLTSFSFSGSGNKTLFSGLNTYDSYAVNITSQPDASTNCIITGYSPASGQIMGATYANILCSTANYEVKVVGLSSSDHTNANITINATLATNYASVNSSSMSWSCINTVCTQTASNSYPIGQYVGSNPLSWGLLPAGTSISLGVSKSGSAGACSVDFNNGGGHTITPTYTGTLLNYLYVTISC